jgi:hypothetical protein
VIEHQNNQGQLTLVDRIQVQGNDLTEKDFEENLGIGNPNHAL